MKLPDARVAPMGRAFPRVGVSRTNADQTTARVRGTTSRSRRRGAPFPGAVDAATEY